MKYGTTVVKGKNGLGVGFTVSTVRLPYYTNKRRKPVPAERRRVAQMHGRRA